MNLLRTSLTAAFVTVATVSTSLVAPAQKAPKPSPNPEIAFDSSSGIKIVNADGSNARTVIDWRANGSWPVWSPDGTKLAFVGDANGQWGLCVVNLDGTQLQCILPLLLLSYPFPTDRPDWSRVATPDGNSKILITKHLSHLSPMHEIVMACNPDGTGAQTLLDSRIGDGYYYSACWSRDCSGIVATGYRYSTDVYQKVYFFRVMARAEGGLEVDLSSGRVIYDPLHQSAIGQVRSSNVQDWITFNQDGQVMLLDVVSGLVRQITASGDNRFPGFAPDDQRLVFWRSGDICTIRVDGTEERMIVRRGGRCSWKR